MISQSPGAHVFVGLGKGQNLLIYFFLGEVEKRKRKAPGRTALTEMSKSPQGFIPLTTKHQVKE